MRIVHLVIGGDVAGGQRVALQLARAARARRDTVSFVAPHDGAFADAVRADGFDVAFVDVRRTYRAHGALELARLLRRSRTDVLHTHTLAAANALGRFAARAAGTRVVSHLHIANHFRPSTRILLATLDNLTARSCAALIAVSEETKRAYLRQGYPDRIVVVHNGVDVVPVDPDGIRAELGVRAEERVVVEVGRLCDVKGQRELIDALARVPGARLVLVGDDLEQAGEYRRALERRAVDAGVADRVVFTGHRDDAERVLAAADVVALPSWTEGLPLVALEAMAQRRAVVATPVGGTPEVVVDGETGLLVPPRDPDALGDALRRVLDDDDLRRRLGEAGHRRVRERFAADAAAARVLELYDEVAR